MQGDRSAGRDARFGSGDLDLLLGRLHPFDPRQKDPFERIRLHNYAVDERIQVRRVGDRLQRTHDVHREVQPRKLLGLCRRKARVGGRSRNRIRDDLMGHGALSGREGADAPTEEHALSNGHKHPSAIL